MNKKQFWILATILTILCGVCIVTCYSNSDNPSDSSEFVSTTTLYNSLTAGNVMSP